MPEPGYQNLGRLAVDRGLINATELREVLEEQERRLSAGEEVDLAALFVERGLLSDSQIEELRSGEADSRSGRLGNFELLGSLGRGGMGAVYLARQVSMDRRVALKVLRPTLAADRDFVQRFVREARLAGKFSHPNLVRAIDVGQADGRYYLAMEYVEGRSLMDLLREKGRLPESEALGYVLQVARALDCAHRHGIIHRDVKPANVLVDAAGTAKLTDLGLAKQVSGETRLTRTGVSMGSPDYMSPEQASGSGEVDIRGDIYSLGVTLFHLVTGRTPFEGPSAIAVMTSHITGKVPWARDLEPEVSERCSRVIARMTAREPEDRYSTPAEVIADLEDVLAGRDPVIAGTYRTSARTGRTLPLGAPVPRAPALRGAVHAAPSAPAAARPGRESGRARLRRWTVNCLAIVGALFLAAVLLGMLFGGERRRNRGAPGPGPESDAPVATAGPGPEPGPGPEKTPSVPVLPGVEDLAAALPAGSLLTAVVAPQARWKKALDVSVPGLLWQQPPVREYLDPLLSAVRGDLKKMAGRIASETSGVIRPEEFADALNGEWGLALVGFRSPGGGGPDRPDGPAAPGDGSPADEDGIVLLAARGEPDVAALRELTATWLRRIEELPPDEGGKRPEVATRQVAGAEMTTVGRDGDGAAWAFSRGCFLMSFDFAAVRAGLEQLAAAGTAPRRPAAGRGEGRLLDLDIDVARLLNRWRNAEPRSADRAALEAAGLGSVRRATYGLELRAPRCFERLRLDVSQPPTGLLRLTAPARALPENPLAAAPPGVLSATALSLPAKELLPQFDRILREVDAADGGKRAAEFGDMLKGARELGLDPDGLLARGLGDRTTLVVGEPGGLLPIPALALVAEVREETPVRELVRVLGVGSMRIKRDAEIRFRLGPANKWAGPGGYEERVAELLAEASAEIRSYRPESVPYGEAELYVMPAPLIAWLRPAAVLSARHLVVGTSPLIAKRTASALARGGPGSLAADPGCRETLGQLSPGAFAVVYVDATRTARRYGLWTLGTLFGKWGQAVPAPPAGRKPPEVATFADLLAPEATAFYSAPGELRVESLANFPRTLPLVWNILHEELEAGAGGGGGKAPAAE